jgi:hypothetical protein
VHFEPSGFVASHVPPPAVHLFAGSSVVVAGLSAVVVPAAGLSAVPAGRVHARVFASQVQPLSVHAVIAVVPATRASETSTMRAIFIELVLLLLLLLLYVLLVL